MNGSRSTYSRTGAGGDTGDPVALRPAVAADKRRVFQWLSHSDATVNMMGPPLYPDVPVVSWKSFCRDYGDHYFDGSRPLEGRCFIIIAGGRDIGAVCHNRVFPETAATDIDIWIHSAEDMGSGYGPAAIRALVELLHAELDLGSFLVYTSRRNPRAINAYLKTGFREIARGRAAELIEFTDADLDYEDGVFLLLEQGGETASGA